MLAIIFFASANAAPCIISGMRFEIRGNNISRFGDIKTLYIDDLCVDENVRGKSIGKQLFEHVKSYAKEIECYNITLNVSFS